MQYHATVENTPYASAYFKMFGNELAYLDIAKIKSRFSEIKSGMNPMKVNSQTSLVFTSETFLPLFLFS